MRKVKILCIGDSLSAGFPDFDALYGGNPESSYQFWMEKALREKAAEEKYEFINRGVCGDTSYGITARFLRCLETQDVDLAIMQGGTNDIGMVPEAKIFATLAKGYGACIKAGIPLIAAGVPPMNFPETLSAIKAVNKNIGQYCAAVEGMFFANWFEVLGNSREQLDIECDAGDGVHFSVAGYKKAGRLLASIVLEALQSRS